MPPYLHTCTRLHTPALIRVTEFAQRILRISCFSVYYLYFPLTHMTIHLGTTPFYCSVHAANKPRECGACIQYCEEISVALFREDQSSVPSCIIDLDALGLNPPHNGTDYVIFYLNQPLKWHQLHVVLAGMPGAVQLLSEWHRSQAVCSCNPMASVSFGSFQTRKITEIYTCR